MDLGGGFGSSPSHHSSPSQRGQQRFSTGSVTPHGIADRISSGYPRLSMRLSHAPSVGCGVDPRRKSRQRCRFLWFGLRHQGDPNGNDPVPLPFSRERRLQDAPGCPDLPRERRSSSQPEMKRAPGCGRPRFLLMEAGMSRTEPARE